MMVKLQFIPINSTFGTYDMWWLHQKMWLYITQIILIIQMERLRDYFLLTTKGCVRKWWNSDVGLIWYQICGIIFFLSCEGLSTKGSFGSIVTHQSGTPIDWCVNHAQSIYYQIGCNTWCWTLDGYYTRALLQQISYTPTIFFFQICPSFIFLQCFLFSTRHAQMDKILLWLRFF